MVLLCYLLMILFLFGFGGFILINSIMIIYQASLKGIRDANEDKHAIILNSDSETNKDYHPINFFGIYDGHGGKEVSTYLGNNLHQYYVRKQYNPYYLEPSKFTKYTNKVYDHIQRKLRIKHFDFAENSPLGSISSGLHVATVLKQNGEPFLSAVFNKYFSALGQTSPVNPTGAIPIGVENS